MVIHYRIYSILAFDLSSLHLSPWKKFLSYALKLLLDFIIMCHYKNALKVLLRLLIGFSFYYGYLKKGMFEISCVHVDNANCNYVFLHVAMCDTCVNILIYPTFTY
jgi:hypothetical protein